MPPILTAISNTHRTLFPWSEGNGAEVILRNPRRRGGGPVTAVQPIAFSYASTRSVKQLSDLLAAGQLDATSVSRAEERDLWASFKASQQEYLQRIGAYIARGATRVARRKAWQMQRSRAARMLALKQSLPRFLRFIPGLTKEEREALRIRRLEAIFANLSAVGDFGEPANARLRLKRKKTYCAQGAGVRPDYRAIFTFPWLDKARHCLLSASLIPFANFHASQVMLRQDPDGRGRSAACEYLLRQLPLMPMDYVFLQFDVRNFFGSISHAWLEVNLGVRQEVVRHHFHTGGMRVATMASARARLRDGEYEELVRRGIPGGSALAPLTGEWVMADVLRGIADHLEGVSLVTYCDNLGIFCRREQAGVTVERLRDAFARHGAGPFELTASAPVSITSEFRFLGYWWRVRNATAEVFVPPEVADTRLLSIGEEAMRASPKELKKLRSKAVGQAAEWKHWVGVAQWGRQALQLIASAESYLVESQATGPIRPVALHNAVRVQIVSEGGA